VIHRLVLASLLLMASWGPTAHGHETRPGLLELTEMDPQRFSVFWKRPAGGESTIRIAPEVPDGCRFSNPDGAREIPGAVIVRGQLECTDGLAGKRLRIAGLASTITDVLVRVERSDGRIETYILRASSPEVRMSGGASNRELAVDYLETGVRHIVGGADHLLFVIGLMMIVRGGMRLVQTITSFTVAHSITLAVAALGYASPPSAPLNLLIALSVMFLGSDVIRAARCGTSLTIRAPYVIAFGFGLLHGFGFADGLSTAGLPRSELPMALLWFNVGVEIAQVSCIIVLLSLARALRYLEWPWDPFRSVLPAYIIGCAGAFWTAQRLLSMTFGTGAA